MPFLMIRNDITKVAADAIVNPANRNLLQGSGTSRAIYQAAGEQELTAACEAIGRCDLGRAVCTPAFGLPATYIFHAVCPAWHGGGFGEAEQLAGAYHSALELAAEYHCESVAFPLLSSGNYGYPKEQAFRIAVDTITQYVMEHDLTVYLVLYDRDSLAVSRKLFASVEEYIDDHYVAQNDESYGFGRRRRELSERRRLLEEDAALPMLGAVPAPAAAPRTARSLESLMDNLGESFTTRLLRLIDERGLKDSTVYKQSNISRQHFSKIQCNRDYNPKRRRCWPLRWGCTCPKMKPSTCSRARAMPFRMAPSGTGSCGTVWNTKSITSIRSIRYCLNTIRNSWARDLSPAR